AGRGAGVAGAALGGARVQRDDGHAQRERAAPALVPGRRDARAAHAAGRDPRPGRGDRGRRLPGRRRAPGPDHRGRPGAGGAGGTVRVAVRRAGDRVELPVTDTGAGIPADLLPHVFDRFVKGPGATGTGLGLAIARDVVAAHGGTIGIESEPGAGTTVRVELP